MKKIKKENIKYEIPLSPYDFYCDGFGSHGAQGNGYLLGSMLGVGKVPLNMGFVGSRSLAGINAFDRAEVEETFLGQINMTIVSSFCGLAGKLWGYDLAIHPDLRKEHALNEKFIGEGNEKIEVFSAQPLLEATKLLFGTVNQKRFPLLPGAHVPCAGKNIKYEGPKRIYSALGMGIPEDRENNAILLMEDLGFLGDTGSYLSLAEERKLILKKLAESYLEIGRNQLVRYKEVFVAEKDIFVGAGEIGCALVAAPYFSLAQKAYTEKLPDSISIHDWEKIVSDNFLNQ